MTGKKWFVSFLILTLSVVLLVGGATFVVDPFFHYREPNKKLYYWLYDQRSQNDGITKRFDYDAIITGTSMAENFLPSEFDELFGTDSIKVCYSGATFKEINDNLNVSYNSGHQLKYVLRPIDYTILDKDKDEMRTDMGEYPVWLTNDNPFDDVKYLLNRDVFLNYTVPCLFRFVTGHEPGHTSFDDYSYTGNDEIFGKERMLGGITAFNDPEEEYQVTSEDMERLYDNLEQNVIAVAKAHPETTFICFLPPYSMAYWGGIKEDGELSKNLIYIRLAAKELTQCENIHLYAFTGELDITTNLEIYRDTGHYDPSVNSRILREIAAYEKGESLPEAGESFATRLYPENVDRYCDDLTTLLKTYDYNSLLAD